MWSCWPGCSARWSSGRPAPPSRAAPRRLSRPELLEAATWRAAQSGLEGNLVDLATATPVPAHRLIGELLAELRPTLESAGDWELMAGLTQAALARGSSAARQRAAYARGGLAKVVDTLLTETRTGTGWLPGAGSARTTIGALLPGQPAASEKRSLPPAVPADRID
jgi:glutamate---cysteine ligase / carboxylate-amine ligase